MSASLAESIALSEFVKNEDARLRRIAARAIFCFSPPEKFAPKSPIRNRIRRTSRK